MVLKQKTNPGKGAPNRCYHANTPVAHEDVKSFLKGVEREASPPVAAQTPVSVGVNKTRDNINLTRV